MGDVMDKEKEMRRLKKERLEILKRNLFLLAFSNLLFLSGFKLLGFGFPFYKDSRKKYNVNVVCMNNYDYSRVTERYLYADELHIYSNRENKIYVKDKYEYDDDLYKRSVKVYKLGNVDDYNDVVDNYLDYVSDNNMIDEYVEINNKIDNKFIDSSEVMVRYYNIDKDKYIRIYESDFKNVACSTAFSLISFLMTVIIAYDCIENSHYINNDIKRLKKLKEDK